MDFGDLLVKIQPGLTEEGMEIRIGSVFALMLHLANEKDILLDPMPDGNIDIIPYRVI